MVLLFAFINWLEMVNYLKKRRKNLVEGFSQELFEEIMIFRRVFKYPNSSLKTEKKIHFLFIFSGILKIRNNYEKMNSSRNKYYI